MGGVDADRSEKLPSMTVISQSQTTPFHQPISSPTESGTMPCEEAVEDEKEPSQDAHGNLVPLPLAVVERVHARLHPEPQPAELRPTSRDPLWLSLHALLI
jgi:hypothetical protein